MEKQGAEVVRSTDVSPADFSTMQISINKLENQRDIAKVIEADIADGDSVANYLSTGKKVEMIDNITKKTITTTISSTQYSDAIKRQQKDISDVVDAMILTPETESGFYSAISASNRLEEISGITSPIKTKFKDFYKSSTGSKVSIDDVRKNVAYTNWMITNTRNSGMNYLEKSNTQISAIVNKPYKKGEDLSKEDKKRKSKIDSILSSGVRDIFAKQNNRDSIRLVNEAVIKIGKGSELSAFTSIPIADKTTNAILTDMLLNSKDLNNAEVYVSNLEYADFGSDIFGFDKQRVVAPKGTSKRAFQSTIAAQLKDYNKIATNDFGGEDIVFEVNFDRDANNYTYTIRSAKDTSRILFHSNGRTVQIIKAK